MGCKYTEKLLSSAENAISFCVDNILNHIDFADKIRYYGVNQFDGILNRLKGIGGVDLTHGAKIYKDCKVENLINYSNIDACFRTLNNGNKIDNWLEFDFKTKQSNYFHTKLDRQV